MALRRVVLLKNSRGGVLLYNLYGTASLSRANSQSEFTEGGTNVWNTGVDYSIQANPRAFILPRWLTFGGAEIATFRWNPTSFRVSTEIRVRGSSPIIGSKA